MTDRYDELRAAAEAQAAFIALANPETIQALLSERESLLAALTRSHELVSQFDCSSADGSDFEEVLSQVSQTLLAARTERPHPGENLIVEWRAKAAALESYIQIESPSDFEAALASGQAGAYLQCAEDLAMIAASPPPKGAGAEPVGEAGSMPGTDGFTMAAFRAADVPIGTKLYAAPSLPVEGVTEAWVLQRNDFPHTVYFNEADARAECARRQEEEIKWREENKHVADVKTYWSVYKAMNAALTARKPGGV